MESSNNDDIVCCFFCRSQNIFKSNGLNLQYMIKEANNFSYSQTFISPGLSAPPHWVIYMYNLMDYSNNFTSETT